jgi:hypothetical protein
MPHLFKLLPFDLAWPQGEVGMLAFEGLDPGHFIRAQYADVLFGKGWRLLIECVDLTHLFIKLLIILGR